MNLKECFIWISCLGPTVRHYRVWNRENAEQPLWSLATLSGSFGKSSSYTAKNVGGGGGGFLQSRALARISEMGVQKYTFGVNWVSNSISSHCIIWTHKNMDIRVSKISNMVSKRHPDTPLWLKACFKGIRKRFILTITSQKQEISSKEGTRRIIPLSV